MIPETTFTGKLTRDPELRYTTSGKAVTQFTIANSDSRKTPQGDWENTRQLFLQCSIWNDENRGNNWAELAAKLTKGQEVAVTGKLHTRKWETKDGSTRSAIELHAFRIYTPITKEQDPHDTSSGFNTNNNTGGFTNTGGFNTPATEIEPPF